MWNLPDTHNRFAFVRAFYRGYFHIRILPWLENFSWFGYAAVVYDNIHTTHMKKMKNNKYHTVGPFPKSNRKIVERDKIDTSNTQIHNLSLFWLATGTPMKSCGVKLVLWPQASSIREMMNIMVTYQYSKQFQKYDEIRSRKRRKNWNQPESKT